MLLYAMIYGLAFMVLVQFIVTAVRPFHSNFVASKSSKPGVGNPELFIN